MDARLVLVFQSFEFLEVKERDLAFPCADGQGAAIARNRQAFYAGFHVAKFAYDSLCLHIISNHPVLFGPGKRIRQEDIALRDKDRRMRKKNSFLGSLLVRFTINVVVTLFLLPLQRYLLKNAASHVLANPACFVE